MAEQVLACLSSQTQLSERLQHLIYLSSSLIFLSGGKGAGKSAIVETLSNSLSECTTEHLLHLHTSLVDVEAREKLVSLFFDKPLFNSNDHLLTSFLQLQKNNLFQEPHLIVIDDAELLSQNIVNELTEILQNKQQITNAEFNILLCCREGYSTQTIQALQNKFSKENCVFEELQIQPLSSHESTLLFLHESNKIVRLNKETLLPELADKLAVCEGNPLKIIKFVNEVQYPQKAQERSKSCPKKKPMTAVNFLLFFAVLFAIFAAGTLYFNPELMAKKEEVNEVVSFAEVVEPDQQIENEQTPDVEALVVSWSDEVEDKSTKENLVLEEKIKLEVEDKISPAGNKVKPEEVILVLQENETLKTQKAIKTEPVVIPPPELVEIKTELSALLTELTVLKNISSRHYTLQLASMSSKQSLEKFFKIYQMPQKNTFVYQTLRNKKVGFVVTYGNYKTFKEAKKASHQLPVPFNKSETWIKKFNLVHKELQNVSE